MKWVAQEDPQGCAIACLAMVTEQSYVAVRESFCDRDLAVTGLYGDEAWHYLRRRGWWQTARYVGDDPESWPPAPFAPVHICNVDQPSGRRHSVVMTDAGMVLDPLCNGLFRLTDWPRVNNVIGFRRDWPPVAPNMALRAGDGA